MRNIFDEASKTCLGMQKTRKKKEWITPDTWQVIKERRQLKKKINDSRSARLLEKYRVAYTEIKKHVKRKIRTDKRAYMEELAKEAEEAAQKGEKRNVYKVTKLICGKYNGSRNAPIRDKKVSSSPLKKTKKHAGYRAFQGSPQQTTTRRGA